MAVRDVLVKEHGETIVDLLEAFMKASVAGQPTGCGAAVRAIVAAGGVFGLKDRMAIAMCLSNGIELARGRIRAVEIPEPVRKASETFTLLCVPVDEEARKAKGVLADLANNDFPQITGSGR